MSILFKKFWLYKLIKEKEGLLHQGNKSRLLNVYTTATRSSDSIGSLANLHPAGVDDFYLFFWLANKLLLSSWLC